MRRFNSTSRRSGCTLLFALSSMGISLAQTVPDQVAVGRTKVSSTRHAVRYDARYVTYLGGEGSDFGVGAHRLENGDVILVVQTGSAGLPTTDDADRSDLSGSSDAYIIRFDPGSGEIVWATYAGGPLQDWVFGMDCDDRAKVCGFAGARELSGGQTRAFASTFSYDGQPVCTFVDEENSTSVGNHYDSPSPDQTNPGSRPDESSAGPKPVIFGSVETDSGDLDAAVWMLDDRTCQPVYYGTTGLQNDDTFFHGFVNPTAWDGPEDTEFAIHGFGAVDADIDGQIGTSEEPLRCVWLWNDADGWRFECAAGAASAGFESGTVYVEGGYDDVFGIVASVYEPMTGKSAIEYWESALWPEAVAPPTERLEMPDGLIRGLAVESSGLLSMTRWVFDDDAFEGVEVLTGLMGSASEVSTERIAFLDGHMIPGGSAVQLLPGNDPGIFSRGLTGYASPGLVASENALQSECPPGSDRCAIYIETSESIRFSAGCSFTEAPLRWSFESGAFQTSGQLSTGPSCTRILPWHQNAGFSLSLISELGDTTHVSSEDGISGDFVVASLGAPGSTFSTIGAEGRSNTGRDRFLYVMNWLDGDVVTTVSPSWKPADSDTVAPGEATRYQVAPGAASLTIRTSQMVDDVDLDLPHRDFIHYAAVWSDSSSESESGHRVSVFDDRGMLIADNSNPPVRVEPVAGLPSVRKATSYPNPFRSVTTLVIEQDAPGVLEVIIFDARGRKLTTLHSGYAPAGRVHIAWDGTSQTGTTLPSGLYLYRIESEGAVAGGQIVLIR